MMVTRKPVPTRQNEQAAPVDVPPYPTSPVLASNGFAPEQQPAADKYDKNPSPPRSRASSTSSHNTWNSGFSDDEEAHGDHVKPTASDVPASLRPGGRLQQAPQPQQLQSHNPYFQHQTPPRDQAQAPLGSENSQAIWDASPSPAPPSLPPPAPPQTQSIPPPTQLAPQPPSADLASLSLNENAWTDGTVEALAPPVIPQKSSRRSLISQSSSNNPWQTDLDRERQRNSASSRTPESSSPAQPAAQFMQPPIQPSHPPPPAETPAPPPLPAPPVPRAAPEFPTSTQQAAPPPAYQPPTSQPPASQPPTLPPFEPSAPLIDLNPAESPSAQPWATPAVETTTVQEPAQSTAPAEPPAEQLKKQTNETYQIKHINWRDASSSSASSVRRSPVLTQNANGPCPLLALVNALTLSTPEHIQTVLIDTLKSREQVSLGLLLDAVFEELARRTEITKKALPDVADLYSFLITLHTGMNVNPQLTSARDQMPGSFEETREMRLYSTFDIPLIHGWLSPSNSPANDAFARAAKTFDEALNVQFAEQELEHKLNSESLSFQEQQLFEDITTIKQFLANYPTQLTDHGLEVMAKYLQPGHVAILFRNDHFSTLYKEPRTGTLMTLVTDAGYSSHDEVVWESLVDVSGAAGGLFSGDFRPIGESAPAAQSVSQAGNGQNSQNTGAPRAHAVTGASVSQPPHEGAQGKTLEQEDADMALALQLQEEEEDAHRQEQAERRRREDELSRQYLDREGASPGQAQQRPPIPPRRSNLDNAPDYEDSNQAPPSADAPYIRASDGAGDNPPPYEQASSDRPFRPPGSTPRQRQGDALGALTALQMQNSAFAGQQNARPASPMHSRRRSSGMGFNQTSSGSQRMRRAQSHGQASMPQQQQQHGGYVPPPQHMRVARDEQTERCVIM